MTYAAPDAVIGVAASGAAFTAEELSCGPFSRFMDCDKM